MSKNRLKLKVDIDGIDRNGIGTKSGKPWFSHVAYAHLPGVPHPQEITIFGGEKPMADGQYEIPYRIRVTNEGRDIVLSLDIANAAPVAPPATQPRTAATA